MSTHKVVAAFWEWLYWYTPGGFKAPIHTAIIWRWRKFVKTMPLLTLLRPTWWGRTLTESRETCGCGRTWFKYRIMPAIFGDKRFGGGC